MRPLLSCILVAGIVGALIAMPAAVGMFFLDRLLVFGLLVLFMVVILAIFFILRDNLARFRHVGRNYRKADDHREQ